MALRSAWAMRAMNPTIVSLASGMSAAMNRTPAFCRFNQERGVTGQPVELRDHQRRAVNPTQCHGFGELRSIVALAALDLDELGHQRPGAAVQVGGDRRALSLEAEAAAALPFGGNPEVRNELALSHSGYLSVR